MFQMRAFCGMVFAFLVSSSLAYELPSGIPDPSWGAFDPIEAIAPSHPSGWPSSEVQNYYYIDNLHAASTDSGNTFGYPDKPRSTIPEITYDAGAYIEIHNGPYTAGGQLIFTANGTEANPVWFRGPSPDDMPIIRGETIVKGSFIVLENLRYDTDVKGIGIRVHQNSSTHHAAIRSCKFTGSGTDVGFTAAIGIFGSLGNRFTDFVIYNNEISELGDDSLTAAENDYHGIIPSSNADRIWILKNKIFNMGGDSVQVGTASVADDQRVSHVYIADNEFYSNHENAVDVKEADQVIVSQNVMYDFYRSETGATGSIVVIHNGATDVFVINNEIYNGNYGIINTAGTNNWYVGNVIHDIIHAQPSWNPESLFSDGVAIHFRGDSSGGALNNTIYNYHSGLQLPSGQSYKISNNVFFNKTEASGIDINVSGGVQANTTFTSNVIYNPGTDKIGWSGIKTVSQWQTNDSQCLDCLTSDPKINIAGPAALKHKFDFSSPVFNAGTDIVDVQNNYLSIFGVEFNTDFFGNPRKTSTNLDIGAYEYPAPTSPPNQPGSPNVTVN